MRVGIVWTFFLSSIIFSLLSLSLWKTARYRLNYCLKGPLSTKQPTNQPSVEKDAKSQVNHLYRAIVIMYFPDELQTKPAGNILLQKMCDDFL